MFGVFIHREDSQYDDHPSERYQFPKKRYLKPAQSLIGRWILYYEPTKVKNSRGYYAGGKVQSIIPDPSNPDMYLAIIEPGSYFEFANPVPFKDDKGLIESGLYNEMGKISGRAQSAIRQISETDFNRILDRGLMGFENPLPREISEEQDNLTEFEEPATEFIHVENREKISYIGNRIKRKPLFRKLVLEAYKERCAFTGLKIINGGGRAEVEAAHIRPVEHNGPDAIRDGLALSGTVHWMFDRGLLSLADNMEIMVSRHINDTDSVEKLIHKNLMACVPDDIRKQPHPIFMDWHRKNCFKS